MAHIIGIAGHALNVVRGHRRMTSQVMVSVWAAP
jgi:hypothetical protein